MLRWLTLLLPLSLLTLVSIAGAARREPAASRWLVFISSRDGGLDLYRMNSDGSDVRKLTNGTGFQYDPSWSPNGQWLVYTSELGISADIYLMRADGTGTRPIAQHPVDDINPRWSPDGQWVAFNSGFDLYAVRPDGTQLQQLTNSPDRFDIEPMWSPDGNWVYFFSGEGLNIVGDLYRIEMTTRQIEQVSVDVNRFVPVLWSDDAERIFVVKGDVNSALYSLRPDGSDGQVLLQAFIRRMAWCPDRTCFLLTINRQPHKLPLNGGSPQVIDDPRLIAYLRGSPDPVGKRVAFAQETENNRADVFIYPEGAGEALNLTRHPANDYNPQWMPIVDLKWHPLLHVVGIVFVFIVKQGLRVMV